MTVILRDRTALLAAYLLAVGDPHLVYAWLDHDRDEACIVTRPPRPTRSAPHFTTGGERD